MRMSTLAILSSFPGFCCDMSFFPALLGWRKGSVEGKKEHTPQKFDTDIMQSEMGTTMPDIDSVEGGSAMHPKSVVMKEDDSTILSGKDKRVGNSPWEGKEANRRRRRRIA